MASIRTAAATLVMAVGIGSTLGTTAASAQGFFESFFGGGPREGRSSWGRNSDFGGGQNFLFGGSRRADDGIFDPADPNLHREMRRRASKGTSNPSRSDSAGPRQTAVVPTEDAPRGSMAYFAKDKTLRAGDVVVTEHGFMIFQGGDQAAPKAFVALAKSGSARANLVALEQASTMRTPNVQMETVSAIRDFVGPRTKEQMAQDAELKRLSVTASR